MILQDSNIHFIRHAETLFNQANEAFKKSQREYQNMSFDELSTLSEFKNCVRFNHDHIDCSITEKGRRECLLAKNQIELSGIIPDVVLVSPFNRTLETCHQIFGFETSFPIIAEPLVGEIFKSSCDVSHPLDYKKKTFPEYDFTECEKYGNRWDLLKNEESHFQDFKDILESNSFISEEERVKHIIEKMNKDKKVKTQKDLLQRSLRFIEKLKEIYIPIYKNIVIVTHFMFLDCVSASEFSSEFIPTNGIKAKNCEIRSMKFSELLEKRIPGKR